MKKITAAVTVCACFAVLLIIMMSNSMLSFGAEENLPTMYVNDEPWYNEAQYKWIKIFLVDYMPISILEKIEGIEITFNKYLRNVMISYGEDKYMTFDIDTSTVYTANGEVFSVSTYLIYGERYIPAKLVCNYLGLRFEMTENETAMRISDGTEKMSFNELLFIFNPALAETETTAQDTTAPTAGETTAVSETTAPLETEEEIGKRTIYFTFSDCPNVYTPEIMDILNDYGYKALFFTDEVNIIKNPSVITSMAVEGHIPGIIIDPADYDDETEVWEEITANRLLYYIIKNKTRIIGAEDTINDEKKLGFESAGYIISEYNSKMPEEDSVSAEKIINTAKKYIHENEIVIYRFYSNENTVSALPEILDYISDKSQFTVKIPNETVLQSSP